MLNKEFLMVGSEALDPVLSIYISPDTYYSPSVSGTLSSGESFCVSNAGETTLKFSEIDLTASILIIYIEGAHLYTVNLMLASTSYSGGAERAASFLEKELRIKDKKKSASISIV